MHYLIATDSYKGSATTFEVGMLLEQGIKKVDPAAVVTKIPLADGGEGTVEAIITALNGEMITKEVNGPLRSKVLAKFGLLRKDTAVIEMAEASGLTLMNAKERNPFITTTYGTGELIKAALDVGVKEIFLGIGGSATNDGGLGMAQALGVSFKDKSGNEVGFGAQCLEDIETIDLSKLDERIKETKISVLSDVNNPLSGKNGASYVYGLQKGALPSDLDKLDQSLMKYGKIIERTLGINIVNRPGAGAAGGLGAGLMAFCDAEVHAGIEKILELLKMESYMHDADIVITGEGKMDSQSIYGKAPLGVSKIAKKLNKPVIAVVGSEGDDIQEVYHHGIDLVIDIITQPMTLDEAMAKSHDLIINAGKKIARIMKLSKKVKDAR